MISRISVSDYLNTYSVLPLIDVRSPGEYDQGHIPGAHNVPLFSNDERAQVGTTYTQDSPQAAIDLGYTFVNPKLDWFIDRIQGLLRTDGFDGVVVHCWRGGMRSRAFAEHLESRGIGPVFVLEGGYKSFRRWVLEFVQGDFPLVILGGYTGSAKTEVLADLKSGGEQVIDLEGLAHHKGSAFGSLGQEPQPTTEHFENTLSVELQRQDPHRRVWVEDESLAIGKVNVPAAFFELMARSPLYFVDIPVEERVKYLVQTYGQFSREELEAPIRRIDKRLGGERTQETLDALDRGDLAAVARLVLYYYDKAYKFGLERRQPERIRQVPYPTIDPVGLSQHLRKFV